MRRNGMMTTSGPNFDDIISEVALLSIASAFLTTTLASGQRPCRPRDVCVFSGRFRLQTEDVRGWLSDNLACLEKSCGEVHADASPVLCTGTAGTCMRIDTSGDVFRCSLDVLSAIFLINGRCTRPNQIRTRALRPTCAMLRPGLLGKSFNCSHRLCRM